MKIVFYPITYSDRSGGSIAMHTLCHELNKVGASAGILHPKVYKHYLPLKDVNPHTLHLSYRYNTPLVEQIDQDNDIILYPEGTPGNPFGFKKVIRWILYYPEKEIESKYGDNDLLVYYNTKFSEKNLTDNRKSFVDRNPCTEEEVVFTFDPMLDVYRDLNIKRDINEAVFVYKASEEEGFKKLEQHLGLLEIPAHLPSDQLVQLLNRIKRVYVYDTDTFTSVIASLCGCEVVVVPKKGLTEQGFKNKTLTQKYGIAYGVENIKKSLSEKPLLLEHLQKRQKEGSDTVSRLYHSTIPNHSWQTEYIK